MEEKWFELMAAGQQKKELTRVLDCNERMKRYGLVLTEEEAGRLLACRKDSLKAQNRVEFGKGILPELIDAFCDSDYVEQDNFADTLEALQEIFYFYKNEAEDNLTDGELITFMREQFDDVCFGSVEYLGETCLERFARAIRAGYEEFSATGGKGEYEKFSEEARWDRSMFLEALEELLI